MFNSGISTKSDYGAILRRTVSGWRSSLAMLESTTRTTSNSCLLSVTELQGLGSPVSHECIRPNYSAIWGSEERSSEGMTSQSALLRIPE